MKYEVGQSVCAVYSETWKKDILLETEVVSVVRKYVGLAGVPEYIKVLKNTDEVVNLSGYGHSGVCGKVYPSLAAYQEYVEKREIYKAIVEMKGYAPLFEKSLEEWKSVGKFFGVVK